MDALSHPPLKVSDSLYQLGTDRFPAYLALGDIGMIIEGGTAPTADLMAAQIAALGLEPGRIRYIALTHTHADHIGAVPHLRQRWPHLKLVAGPRAAAYLRSPAMLESFLPADRMISKIFLAEGLIDKLPQELSEYRFEVDLEARDGDELDLGQGQRWRVRESPGHSACHMSYYEPGQGVLALGDMAGYYDPALEIIWPNYFSGLQDYVESLLSASRLPARLGLLSHNGAIRGDLGLFLQRALAVTMQYHAEVLDRLSRGEDEAELCARQADWVYSFAPIASPKAIRFLCQNLCKQSRRAGDQAAGALDLFAAASLGQGYLAPSPAEAVAPSAAAGAAR